MQFGKDKAKGFYIHCQSLCVDASWMGTMRGYYAADFSDVHSKLRKFDFTLRNLIKPPKPAAGGITNDTSKDFKKNNS